ncbi:MAG: hypothetical protein WB791_05990, partial [Waddliaceae bacterium]
TGSGDCETHRFLLYAKAWKLAEYSGERTKLDDAAVFKKSTYSPPPATCGMWGIGRHSYLEQTNRSLGNQNKCKAKGG